jgi:NAD(P)H-dependent FMN reductase
MAAFFVRRLPRCLLHPQAFSTATEKRNPCLLLVFHSRTGLAKQLADELERGAVSAAAEMEAPLDIQRRAAADATIDDVLNADGYLFCAPENLASVSGEMKEFFDRCYYPVFSTTTEPAYEEVSQLLGRPYGMAIAAGSDGSGAARQLERICQGWRLRPVADTLIHKNGLTQTKENILATKPCLPEATKEQCAELGGLVAATLLL